MEDIVTIGKAVAARKKRGKRGKAGTVVVNAEALWGMHALRRRRGDRVALAGEPREDDVGHCARGGLFSLMVSEPKTENMCLLPKGMEECQFTVSAGDQTHKQTDRSVYILDGPSPRTGKWTRRSRTVSARRSRTVSAGMEVLTPA